MLKEKRREISRFIKECGIDYKEKTYYESGVINSYEIGGRYQLRIKIILLLYLIMV